MVTRSGHRAWRTSVFTLGFLVVLAWPARAQSSIAFSGGASIDPKQVYAGVAWESPNIGGRFRFRPGIDGGLGDGLRLGTINIDFVVGFPLGTTGWTLIQGGGPVISISKLSDDLVVNPPTELHAGGSYLFGFRHDNGFFAEFRLGGGGYTPNLKFGAGWAIEIK
ncbi:MAG: hypothetical protein ABI665_04655 [Vicinamibacterales bacterium]